MNTKAFGVTIQEIAASMANSFNVNEGDRIAQMIISPIVKVELIEVQELDETERGEGGFGSTDAIETTMDLLDLYDEIPIDYVEEQEDF